MMQDAPRQSITLNLPYNLPDDLWARVLVVYEGMPGWLCLNELPRWFGSDSDPRHIWASVEPSGLLLEGQLEGDEWAKWTATLCNRLSNALGFEVRDADA